MTKLSQYHLEAYGCPLPKITLDEEAVASFMKVQPRLDVILAETPMKRRRRDEQLKVTTVASLLRD